MCGPSCGAQLQKFCSTVCGDAAVSTGATGSCLYPPAFAVALYLFREPHGCGAPRTCQAGVDVVPPGRHAPARHSSGAWRMAPGRRSNDEAAERLWAAAAAVMAATNATSSNDVPALRAAATAKHSVERVLLETHAACTQSLDRHTAGRLVARQAGVAAGRGPVQDAAGRCGGCGWMEATGGRTAVVGMCNRKPLVADTGRGRRRQRG